MKQITKVLIFFGIIFNLSCENKDCEDNLCFTPPSPFNFELIDKSTGENLFTNGIYNSDDIEIINISDNSKIEYFFNNENEINIIQIGSLGWKSEVVDCSLRINNSEILRLYVNAKRISENCCSFTRYDEIRIENAEYEYDNQSGIYRIPILVQDYTDCIEGELDIITNSDQILGEWKLTRSRVLWVDYRNWDFSNENIIYNFKPDGILVVTENGGIGGFEKGEYSYEFKKDYLSNSAYSNEPMVWLVKISNSKWTYKSQNDLMVIGQSYVDGTDLCFERKK